MSRKKVMIVDLDNFLDTSLLDEVLDARGIEVRRPRSQWELVKKFLVSKWGVPDLILVLYYTFEQLTWLLPLLRQAEGFGIKVANSSQNLGLFANYPLRSQILKGKGFAVPLSFYGSSSEIPEKIGERVVWKSLNGHQTILSFRTGIHCLSESVYVESFIPNPEKRVLTVYHIAGLTYARWKEDPLQTKIKTRELIKDLTPYANQCQVAEKIASEFGLVFGNVEFVGDHVIDVNSIANIFYRDHLAPLEALADWIEAS